MKCKASTVEDFTSIDQVIEAIQVQTCYRLRRIIEERKASKATKKDFVNSLKALDIVSVAQDHVKIMSLIIFKSITIPNSDFKMRVPKCKVNREIILQIGTLFGLCMLKNDHHGLYECGYFVQGPKYSELIIEAIKTINKKLRPRILSICEMFTEND